ncbi:MAG: AAA family ATPase, partial [Polaromonas sp.]
MKIRTLFLRAFGPFTDATLYFSGPARLHLIYGANEAGKSSALRAITDLRYGIPPRSKDDFVHEFKDMRLAGCFEDVAGRALGLARRKGNKDTLMSADTDSGEPLASSSVSPDVLLALTGGVAREQFETMYGLDSSNLRKGGRMLIQGEGELGAALFEASTGSAGIKAMLQTLQTDAKKYFTPKGQLPILNEAARQLDEARQRYKLAVTKPDQWKALKRAHETAQGQLAALREQLTRQRRRLAELTELRAVAPLLQEIDLAERQFDQSRCHLSLPADSRERRLAALQHQARSQDALTEADEAIAECRQALGALKIEPLLISHAPAIDRLEADLSLVRRESDLRRKLQAASDDEAAQLMLQAQRMTPAGTRIESLDDFFRHTPSSADQAKLARALELFQTLTLDFQQAQARLGVSGRKLAQLQREGVDEPAAPLQQALSLALEQAQSLGDGPRRLAELHGALTAEQRKLDRSLTDLGLQSLEQLALSRWLAAAEIDAYERARSELLKRAALDDSRREQLQTDLAAQQRRGKTLAASGEVVTADTLRLARDVRDQGWQTIRAVFIKPKAAAHEDMAGQDTLADKFERLQAQADRQADLLREGAQRAAEVAECAQRIAEMTQTLAALRASQTEQGKLLATLDENWQQTLSRLALPGGTAAAVREWLTLRQTALERQERLDEAKQAHEVLAQRMAEASTDLLAALLALGRTLPEAAHRFEALIALGTSTDRDLVATRAAVERRRTDMLGLQQEIEADQAGAAELAQQLQACQIMLEQNCRHLHLGNAAASDVIKARLAELQR